MAGIGLWAGHLYGCRNCFPQEHFGEKLGECLSNELNIEGALPGPIRLVALFGSSDNKIEVIFDDGSSCTQIRCPDCGRDFGFAVFPHRAAEYACFVVDDDAIRYARTDLEIRGQHVIKLPLELAADPEIGGKHVIQLPLGLPQQPPLPAESSGSVSVSGPPSSPAQKRLSSSPVDSHCPKCWCTLP